MEIFGKITIVLAAMIVVSCGKEKPTNEKSVVNHVVDPVSIENKNVFKVPDVPDSVSFAGEWISLTDFDVRERFDRELVVNNFWHSNTILYIKRANRWFPLMSAILKEENIPQDFLYLAVIESGLTQATSPSDAKGFWQFLEGTAREYGLQVDNEVDERFHIEKSTRAACKYLKTAHNKFNSWTLAAAAYNMGKNGIDNRLDDQNVNSYFDLSLNTETSRYVFRILAVKEIMNHPKKYGFEIEPYQLYPPIKHVKVQVEGSITDLSEWAVKQGINLKILQMLNPWLIGNKLTVQGNSNYEIYLPENNEQLGTYKG
ncbi:MAG: lytic transglycosylase domain-containing protein [Brumimicrobium sp.]|nr:lytic transglycosylase domain-containing protein [Brumimicrobium sp.]